jgi:hypothetical protein
VLYQLSYDPLQTGDTQHRRRTRVCEPRSNVEPVHAISAASDPLTYSVWPCRHQARRRAPTPSAPNMTTAISPSRPRSACLERCRTLAGRVVSPARVAFFGRLRRARPIVRCWSNWARHCAQPRRWRRRARSTTDRRSAAPASRRRYRRHFRGTRKAW